VEEDIVGKVTTGRYKERPEIPGPGVKERGGSTRAENESEEEEESGLLRADCI
jgi:hypothetical protein